METSDIWFEVTKPVGRGEPSIHFHAQLLCLLHRVGCVELIKARSQCLELARIHYKFPLQPDNISVRCFAALMAPSFLF